MSNVNTIGLLIVMFCCTMIGGVIALMLATPEAIRSDWLWGLAGLFVLSMAGARMLDEPPDNKM